MSGRFKILLKCIGLSLFLSTTQINAQLLQDSTLLNLVKQDINFIYNLQFDDARKVHEKISQLYPEHPVVFLLRAIMTYWEDYPLLYKTSSHDSFEEDLRRCIELSEMNKNPAFEAEYLLTNLSARGMLLMFYADNGLIIKVIPLTVSTYQFIRLSFDFTSYCEDLYYFTGLYNYYREAYPEAHPVYKSLALLFPEGDTERGKKELYSAAVNSIVLKAESYVLLTWIYLNYENKYPEALYYAKSLHQLYPYNALYLALYIKNLLLMEQYDEAEKLIIVSTAATGNIYFQAQLSIFKGILQEKKYLNYNLAQQYYEKGISDITFYGEYGNEYAAYAYYGLSRISQINGEKHTYKIYRKEAMKLSVFKKITFD